MIQKITAKVAKKLFYSKSTLILLVGIRPFNILTYRRSLSVLSYKIDKQIIFRAVCQNSLNVGTCLWHVEPTNWFSGLTSQSDVPTLLKFHILTHRCIRMAICKANADALKSVPTSGQNTGGRVVVDAASGCGYVYLVTLSASRSCTSGQSA